MWGLGTVFERLTGRRSRKAPQAKGVPDVIHPDDSFIISYPRSGNTWLRYLLANLIAPATEWDRRNINEAMPDIYQVGDQLGEYARPRFIKSHEPYLAAYPRVLLIYRDGRDVAVSYHDMMTKNGSFRGDFDAFLSAYLQGDLPYGSWHEHVASWLMRDHEIPFLAVRYEDMCARPADVLTKMAGFLSIETDEARLEAAVEKCSFDWFKQNIKQHHPLAKTGFQGGVQGGPGKWKDVFTASQLEAFWESAGETMEALGYSKAGAGGAT